MFSFFPDLISVQNFKRNTTVEPRYNERPRFVRYNEIEVFVISRNFSLCFTISEAKKIVRLIYRGLRYIEVPLYVRITLIIYHCEDYPIVIALVLFSETQEAKTLLSKLFYSKVTASLISTRVLPRRAAKKGTIKVKLSVYE